jgi:hypothetical protein
MIDQDGAEHVSPHSARNPQANAIKRANVPFETFGTNNCHANCPIEKTFEGESHGTSCFVVVVRCAHSSHHNLAADFSSLNETL